MKDKFKDTKGLDKAYMSLANHYEEHKENAIRQVKDGAFVDLLNQEIKQLKKATTEENSAIEEMAKDKQWQRRDNYCLRIQKALQYKGTDDNEDVPSILVDFENEIRKEMLPEDSVVLSREELSKRDYEFRQIGYDECLRDNPKKDKYIKKLERKIDQLNAKLDQSSKETAEKILNGMLDGEIGAKYPCKVMGVEKYYELAKQFGVEIKES